ncbi:MAG TPA: hypothetical protein ENI23_09095 [bacterium]|nr:hypothetical protein [bacterium]
MLTWFVNYKNGKTYEYDSEKFNLAHIDKSRLDTIVIQHEKETIPTLVVHFDDPRKQPIYVKRRQLPDGLKEFETRCHIVGWQMNVKGENIQSISYVFETIGRKEGDVCWIETAGKFDQSRNSWFKSPTEEQLGIIGSKASEVNNGVKN